MDAIVIEADRLQEAGKVHELYDLLKGARGSHASFRDLSKRFNWPKPAVLWIDKVLFPPCHIQYRYPLIEHGCHIVGPPMPQWCGGSQLLSTVDYFFLTSHHISLFINFSFFPVKIMLSKANHTQTIFQGTIGIHGFISWICLALCTGMLPSWRMAVYFFLHS